jgi:hypothetical protein
MADAGASGEPAPVIVQPGLAANASRTRVIASPSDGGEDPSIGRTTGYGNSGGAIRRRVACSKAYPSARSFGSLHAIPVKLTP